MDHDHETGEFRAIICLSCNSSLPKQIKNKKKIINNIEIDEVFIIYILLMILFIKIGN